MKKRIAGNLPSPTGMLQQPTSMRPLIRLLAAQAVKRWVAGNSSNTATTTTHEGNEGNDLRTV